MPSIAPLSKPALQGVSNFRDLGGHTGLDGRRVRTGLVFRSDHLAGLTPDDHRTLQALQLTHSLDFRGISERAALPSVVPGAAAVSLAIEPTVVVRVQALLARGQVPTEAETVELMCQTYRAFTREAAPTYARFLRHLLEQPTPVVFHCTAGKDRTGFAAALLLGALGVERDAVMADYLLTNQLYRRSPLVEAHGPAHVMDVLWQVQPAFLQAAFDAIDTDVGGLSNYLEGSMGLGPHELERLRERLLET
ncbi:MAG: tyrosine-protein phosphatase [Hydrogenophaga sp.]|uniref:tyrosine-protein phosphatase n=1 Tax=Hydrogenophaga sp. TaxID=1904254 RepID=UPI002733A9A1|nr:tyrosine-protein phosphatase [Hydrogenophaga sp.]MDP3626402.1 tyrosine-protein phosphatase [Hydrogenophaga sp.]